MNSASRLGFLALLVFSSPSLNAASKQSTLPSVIKEVQDSAAKSGVPPRSTCPECTVNAPKKAAPDVCNDLARLTCAPGKYADGTGAASNGSTFDDPVEALKKKLTADALAKFTRILNDKSQPEFLRTALAGLGLDVAPHCKIVGNDVGPECIQDAAAGLTDLVIKRSFKPMDMFAAMISAAMGADTTPAPKSALSDFDALLESPVFKEQDARIQELAIAGIKKSEGYKRIREVIFPEIRERIADEIGARVEDKAVQARLVARIRAIKFDDSESCGKMGKFMAGGGAINPYLIPNAFYDPDDHTFTYCNGLMINNSSDFSIASIVAHELAHSIDPCIISRQVFFYTSPFDLKKSTDEYPLKGLINCLRSEDSVAARSASSGSAYPYPSPNPSSLPSSGPSSIPSSIPSSRPSSVPKPQMTIFSTPNPSPSFSGSYNSIFCSGDQIGESVSDWVAAEILPGLMKSLKPQLTSDQSRLGYSNIFRVGFCELERSLPAQAKLQDPHPPMESRINRIILVQPEVRKQMQCMQPISKGKYCPVAKAGSAK
jgi:hypothetical protein